MRAPSNKRLDEIVRFMKERHSIYISRIVGAARPWTEDQILQRYRFCNVYRELDTVTQWIDQHVRKPFNQHLYLWFMLTICRQINHVPTLEELLGSPRASGAWPWDADKWNWKWLRKVLRDRAERGAQVYTAAYLLNAHGASVNEPNDKPHFTARHVLKSVWDARHIVEPALYGTLEAAWSALLPYHGWGPFTAYEVVTDLRHTRYLDHAPDIMTWANAGPGARRGLNRLYGRETRAPAPAGQLLAEMRLLLPLIQERWPKGPLWPALELREIEHSLCEFDKYERTRLDEGKPRRKFNGYDNTLPTS